MGIGSVITVSISAAAAAGLSIRIASRSIALIPKSKISTPERQYSA
jgi:hypothetical protein